MPQETKMNVIMLWFIAIILLSFNPINCVVVDEDYADVPAKPETSSGGFVVNATHTRLGRLGKTLLCMADYSVLQNDDFQWENKSFISSSYFYFPELSLCTHAIFAYAPLCKDLSNCTDDEVASAQTTSIRLATLKEAFPNVRVGVSLGGYDEGSLTFSNSAKDLWSRFQFVKNNLGRYRNASIDAVELAWFAPTIRYGGKPEDRENYIELIKELKKDAGRMGWHIGVAIKIINGNVDYYDIKAITPHVDWIRLEAHGFRTHWEDTAGFNAPIYSIKGDRKTVAYWVNYVSALTDTKRLLLDVPLYGRGWALADEPIPGGPGSPAIGGFSLGSQLPYSEICEMLQNKSEPSWQDNWDPYSLTPWAINDKKYISYDNERSLIEKVEFARYKKLAGISVNSLEMDDNMGSCGNRSSPLLRAIHEALKSATNLKL